MLELLKSFYEYNSWANNQMLEQLTALTPDQYTAPGCSGHDSIRDTLAHMMSVQMGYLSFFDGSKTIAESMAQRITGDAVANPEAAMKRWKELDAQAWKYINGLDEDKAAAAIKITIPTVVDTSLPMWKLLLQVANHTTHHRAQILAAMRRFGIKLQGYDYIQWVLMKAS